MELTAPVVVKQTILVIYESPSKFSQFKGAFSDLDNAQYVLAYTGGHLLDLPRNEIGIKTGDIENIKLEFIKPAQKKWVYNKITECDVVYCLTDNDSEGEFIASNIKDICIQLQRLFFRVRVNELTKEGIRDAIKLKTPHLKENLVNLSLSRRIVDRVIGYHNNSSSKTKRGRIFTPLISSLQKKPINKISFIEYFYKNGIKLGIETRKGRESDILNLLSGLSSDDFIITECYERDTYNTQEYMKESTIKGGCSRESFNSLQKAYESGDISYPRTENKRFYVHEDNHSGIKSTKDNITYEDIIRESDEGIRNIMIKTLAEQNEAITVFNVELSDKAYHALAKMGLIRYRGVKIIYSETRFSERVISDGHYLENGGRNESFTVHEPSLDYYLLDRLGELGIGTPSTLCHHVENISPYVRNEERVLPDFNAMRVLNSGDYITERLKSISISKSIDILLHNNDLKVEDKVKKCLNMLHLRSNNINDIDLDNNI